MKSKFIGVLLSLMLVLGLIPNVAFAATSNTDFQLEFTKIVELEQGSAVPPATDFNFRLTHIGADGNPDGKSLSDCGIGLLFDDIQVLTNGTGNYTGKLEGWITSDKVTTANGWVESEEVSTSGKIYTCEFKLTEVKGTETGWTYDDEEYIVVFEYNTDGTKSAYFDTQQPVVFTNAYTYNPSTADFSIKIEKTVEQGGALVPGKEDFTFLLRDANGKTPADYGITITGDKIATDGKGTFNGTLTGTFGVDTPLRNGNWQSDQWGYSCIFYLTEQNDGKDGWKYSDKKYTVEISYNPNTKMANADVTIPGTDASETPAFTNTYTMAAKSPETGDDSDMGIWIALMLAAAVCAAGTVLYSRKSRSER